MNSYATHFQVYRKDQTSNALTYLKGLTTHNLDKNMERMVEVDADADLESIQHFITDSPWSYRDVMDHTAQDANQQIGHEYDAGLIIDESGVIKKGKNSVGVARQWIGNMGKVENGQVGVYGSLINGEHRTIVDARLYLPEEWTSDESRLIKAKVPENERIFKTKEAIAFEIVQHLHDLGLKYGWVGGDAGYGKNLEFALKLETLGKIFMLDIHKDQKIYLELPQFAIPNYSGRGRKPKIPKPEPQPVRVDEWIKSQSQVAWQKITVRQGTKGPVEYEYLINRVWVYSSDYQLRTWRGWHHHMALVMMAMLFLLSEKIENQEETPLLTGRDINELLTFFLRKESPTEQEVFRRINNRHKKRQRDIENAFARKLLSNGS